MLNNFLCRLQDWMISIVLRYYTSEQAHCATPPFQIEPAALGFDLVLGAISKENRFYPLIAKAERLTPQGVKTFPPFVFAGGKKQEQRKKRTEKRTER